MWEHITVHALHFGTGGNWAPSDDEARTRGRCEAMLASMKGKVAVITGGAGMIGHAAAMSLAAAGADLMLVDINAAGLAARRGANEALRGCVQTHVADVSSSSDVAAYVASALQAFGHIDAFFNNAGIEGKLGPTHEYDEAEFDKIIAVNLKGIFLGLRHVLPVMLRQGQGAVVNTGSIASERGLAGACAYNASKHAVIGLTRTAASEVRARGARVNAVMPGVIDNPLLEAMLRMMFAGDVAAGKRALGKVATLDRIGSPAEVGEVVRFLLSDAASFVNGAAWAVDGGALSTIRH